MQRAASKSFLRVTTARLAFLDTTSTTQVLQFFEPPDDLRSGPTVFPYFLETAPHVLLLKPMNCVPSEQPVLPSQSSIR